jgi:hypothetical protein
VGFWQTVGFFASVAIKMNVQIMNGAGQVVKQYTNVTAANQLLQIPVSALASGTYFLYLQSGREKQVLQFVKE